VRLASYRGWRGAGELPRGHHPVASDEAARIRATAPVAPAANVRSERTRPPILSGGRTGPPFPRLFRSFLGDRGASWCPRLVAGGRIAGGEGTSRRSIRAVLPR